MAEFRKVTSGDPLKIPAADYNAMIDAAAAFARQGGPEFQGGQAGPFGLPPAVTIRVRNTTGSFLPAFSPVARKTGGLQQTVVIFDAANAFDEFTNPILDVAAPFSLASQGMVNDTRHTFHTWPMITRQALDDDEVGYATLQGITPVRMRKDEAYPGSFAVFEDGNTDELLLASYGPAYVIGWDFGGGGPAVGEQAWGIVWLRPPLAEPTDSVNCANAVTVNVGTTATALPIDDRSPLDHQQLPDCDLFTLDATNHHLRAKFTGLYEFQILGRMKMSTPSGSNAHSLFLHYETSNDGTSWAGSTDIYRFVASMNANDELQLNALATIPLLADQYVRITYQQNASTSNMTLEETRGGLGGVDGPTIKIRAVDRRM